MKAVYSYTFVSGPDLDKGREDLFNLEEGKGRDRRYTLDHPVYMIAECDIGRILARSEAGFVFDGRSGSPLIDRFIPNLGSMDERAAWLFHDLLAYGQSLDFEQTNSFLRCFLRDQAGYSRFKAWVVEKAVGMDDSWYGEPPEGDWCRCNLGKVQTIWVPA